MQQFPSTLAPLSIAAWRELAKERPSAVADEVHRRAAFLLDSQQHRAIFATLFARTAIEYESAAAPKELALSGVPYVVKDLFDVQGLPTGAGSGFLSEVRPVPCRDAEIVGALRNRGAVLVGKTQLHEFAYGLTGENPFWGNCRNPLDANRTTGGSSSGSAASVAAGVVPFAIGTDTGGSVRIPAAHCGIYGYRGAPGDCWIGDAFPLAPSCDAAGFFTRSAEDMRIVLDSLLVEPTGESTDRSGFLELGRLDNDVVDSFRNYAPAFGRALDSDEARELRSAFSGAAQAYSILTSREAAVVHAPWLDLHREHYSPEVWGRIDRGRHWSVEQLAEATAIRDRIRTALTAYFWRHDALVIPAAPTAAPRHEECAAYDRTRILDLTAPASLAGLPVLVVPTPLPCGLSSGLQVIVRPSETRILTGMLRRAADSLSTPTA